MVVNCIWIVFLQAFFVPRKNLVKFVALFYTIMEQNENKFETRFVTAVRLFITQMHFLKSLSNVIKERFPSLRHEITENCNMMQKTDNGPWLFNSTSYSHATFVVNTQWVHNDIEVNFLGIVVADEYYHFKLLDSY